MFEPVRHILLSRVSCPNVLATIHGFLWLFYIMHVLCSLSIGLMCWRQCHFHERETDRLK